jgi:hypothetical protein
MSVNPNLQTLMGLIDELQDQMPEGKYLEAMNALRDLHAIPETRPRPPPPPRERVPVPAGYVEMTPADNRIWSRAFERSFRSDTLPAILRALGNRDLWAVVCRDWNKEQTPPLEDASILTCYPRQNRAVRHNPSTEQWWVTRPAEQKLALIHEALLRGYERHVKCFDVEKNPELAVCPFISRHSVGKWEDPNRNPRSKWNCVCGSVNLLAKNWRQHEVSDKHTKWVEEGRRVAPCMKKKMLDVACHVRSKEQQCDGVTRATVVTWYKPSVVWEKSKKDKNWNPNLRICQGVHCTDNVERICGYEISWTQPHDTYRPQSLNEWFCSELKDTPWEYAVVNPRWITKVGEPTIKQGHQGIVSLEPRDDMPPPLPELPHRSGGMYCHVRGDTVWWMDEERYARFISVQWEEPARVIAVE